MINIKAGDLLEICVNCHGCGISHPCGEETCKHDYAFAIEDERDETVLARFFLIGDQRISTHTIVGAKWAGWIPEEI